jgi:nucleotide-binding universal stress UspA family protein
MKTFLVPLTLSDSSCPVLAIAGGLARERNAKLVLLHAVQLNIAGEERGIQRARLLDEMARNADTRLREMAAGMDGPESVETLVCEGRPADVILETARDLQADAIVMRMRGHRGLLKWLNPNTAPSVARQAPCRVWLVSNGKHAESLHLTVVDPRSSGRNTGIRDSARPMHFALRSLAREARKN